MSAVRIEVTLEDIARGERCQFAGCAIALAAARVFPGLGAGVERGALWLDRPDTVDRPALLPLPPEAIAFVRAFDSGCAVRPFSFEVETPPC